MIKYIILRWEKEDLSDIRVVCYVYSTTSKIFDTIELADIYAKKIVRHGNYRCVKIPILDK